MNKVKSVYIYKLIDPRFPDVVRYIGKTTRSRLNNRLSEHVCHSKEKKSRIHNWIQSILKFTTPKIELVEVCNEFNWEEREKYYIKIYSSSKLTNIEPGGKSDRVYVYNKKGTNKNAKPVVQMSLDGDYIQEFKSCSEAGRVLNLNHHVISATCRGIQAKAYGYRWKFLSDKNIRKKNHSRSRQIIQYDLNLVELNRFDSITEASKATGARRTGIDSCARGIYKTSGGFIWKFNTKKIKIDAAYAVERKECLSTQTT